MSTSKTAKTVISTDNFTNSTLGACTLEVTRSGIHSDVFYYTLTFATPQKLKGLEESDGSLYLRVENKRPLVGALSNAPTWMLKGELRVTSQEELRAELSNAHAYLGLFIEMKKQLKLAEGILQDADDALVDDIKESASSIGKEFGIQAEIDALQQEKQVLMSDINEIDAEIAKLVGLK